MESNRLFVTWKRVSMSPPKPTPTAMIAIVSADMRLIYTLHLRHAIAGCHQFPTHDRRPATGSTASARRSMTRMQPEISLTLKS